MKTSYWFILAFIAIVIVAIVLKRQQDSAAAKAKLDFDEFKDDFGKAQPLPFMSAAIDNGANMEGYNPSWLSMFQ